VLVGVNSYQDDVSHPPLAYAVHDAIGLFAFLTHPRFTNLARERVRLLLTGTDRSIQKTAERVRRKLVQQYELDLPPDFVEDVLRRRTEPAMVQVVTAVRQAAADATSDDLLLVYFSGHGCVAGGVPFLLPFDAHPDAYPESAVRLDRLREILGNCEARSKVIVFDACDAGSLPPATSQQATSADGDDVVIFSSSLESQPSLETGDEAENGIFTRFLLDGLSGRADGMGLGCVTLHDLADYVTREVVEWIRRNVAYTRRQTPSLNEAGDRLGRRIVLSGARPRPPEQEYEDDLFVSYAVEDRHAVIPLIERLIGDGYFVWFDERQARQASSVDSSRYVLMCLSDAYGTSEPTVNELNRVLVSIGHERTVPVMFRPIGRTSADIKPFLRPGVVLDLSDPASFETEYQRLTQRVVKRARGPRLPSPAEIRDLRTFGDAIAVQGRIARYSRQLFVYLWKRCIAGLPPQGAEDLAGGLMATPKLPAHIKNHIRTLKYTFDLINHSTVERPSPAMIQTLRELLDWVTTTYHVVPEAAGSSDSFDALWLELRRQTGRPVIPEAWYELVERDTGGSSVGRVYPGRNVKDEAPVDVLLAPVSPRGRSAFEVFCEQCRKLPPTAPVAVDACGQFELPESGRWGYLALHRTEGVSVRALSNRFRPMPATLALAIARQIVAAYEALVLAPAFIPALFEPSSVIVDRSGFIRLKRDWTVPAGTTPPAEREAFWFAGHTAPAEAPLDVQPTLVAFLGELLSASGGDTATWLPHVDGAADVRRLAGALPAPIAGQMSDQDLLKTAVECYLESRDLPAWLSTPAPIPGQGTVAHEEAGSISPASRPEHVPGSPQTNGGPGTGSASPPVPKTGPSGPILKAVIQIEAQAAWPLGEQQVLSWGTDATLRVHEWAGGALAWSDSEPMLVRCWSRGHDGAYALGGWDGEVRWFVGGALCGRSSVGWTVAAIQPLDGKWIAGVWNGDVVVLGGEQSHKWLPVDDGVYKIATAVSSVAVLGLSGFVAEYDGGGHRIRQAGPIDGAVDIAFANGTVVVLTEDGRLWTLDGNRARRPDRLPGREGVRLVARDGVCLFVNARGYTWRIDRAGTYPPDAHLPAGHILNASSDLRRCVTSRDGAITYWRNGKPAKVWFQATDAVVSPAGDTIVVTLPDRIELWADEGHAS
jgi:uncharacterized caspase-like protein